MKKQRIALIVLIVLLLPTISYLVLTYGKHNSIAPPYFGPRKAVEVTVNGRTKTDTVYYTIPTFSLTDQNGQPFGSQNLKGKTYIATFLESNGSAEENRMVTILQDVVERLTNDHRIKGRNFHILTITTNPEKDSVATLKAFANRLNVSDTMWTFLTGNKDTIAKLAAEGFLLNTLAKPAADGNVFNAHKFLLVDNEGHIRSVCNGTILMEVNKMVDDVKGLYAWYARPKKGQKNIPDVEQHRD